MNTMRFDPGDCYATLDDVYAFRVLALHDTLRWGPVYVVETNAENRGIAIVRSHDEARYRKITAAEYQRLLP